MHDLVVGSVATGDGAFCPGRCDLTPPPFGDDDVPRGDADKSDEEDHPEV